jgi:hypothetical protein
MLRFNIRRRVRRSSPGAMRAFEDCLAAAQSAGSGALIDYRLPYPKAEFLCAVCDHLGYVAHGSKQDNLQVLLPIRNSSDTCEFGRRQVAFASPDAMWALWFAILDKRRMGGQTRNGCLRVSILNRQTHKLYFFAVPNHVLIDGGPFSEGTIYLLPAEPFQEQDKTWNLGVARVSIEQWGSRQPVAPIARLHVRPEDFPYLSKVQGFRYRRA